MTLMERLAAYFRARPNTWIDGVELASVAGCYAWRSRCSDLRRPPHSMTIQNRQRHVKSGSRRFVVSEYRYLPPDPTAHHPAPDADASRSQRML